ncbi:MAG: NADH-quinone oxidoreductase subunit L [Candidatus Poribacteria bacterium]|nr:NADH-quinone oxidoreductase subunit L [Candidatus Poribacteria bacterium]
MSEKLIIVLLISPLVGFLINGLFGKWLKGNEKLSGGIGALAVLVSLIFSIIAFISVKNGNPLEGDAGHLYSWIVGGDFAVNIGFHVDALTTVMLLVITGVGFLIHVYSIGYMHGDEGYTRYFAYLNLFVFAMLILVLGNNYLMMFVGWEGVGLCSYLLIGFWYEKQTATDAGKKAFIVNRIGDFGFLLGMFTLFAAFGSLDFVSIFDKAEAGTIDIVFGETTKATLMVATLLLFVGAIGKSAQLPLYVWLPDAMEGPTPVSALIHAATMVTAGVYMIARSGILYNLAGTGWVVAWIGVLTALFAAIIALKQNDIKRILAYSTVSQLGYMFVGVGVGAYASGIFHLVTHAFFKGLMFLTAGSVMHAMANELDIRKMGGLRKKLPITHVTFLVGALAIAGAPFLSGFWSKDEILHSAWGSFPFIYIIGLITAFLTAFYMFRLIFVTFYGQSRVEPEVESHLHESPAVMWLPLVILAVPSALIGLLLGVGGHHSWFHHFTENVFPKAHETSGNVYLFMAISSVVGIAGIAYAWKRYKNRVPSAEPTNTLQQVVANKFYVDEVYNTFIVQPIKGASHFLLWKLFDSGIIDGIVNGVAALIRVIGGMLRRLQTGIVQAYIVSMVVGIVLFLAYYLFFA